MKASNLPPRRSVGARPYIIAGLVALAAISALMGSLALLWWALGQRHDETEPPVTPDAS